MSLSLVSTISSTSTECAVTGGIENVKTGGVILIESELISFGDASVDGFLTLIRGIGGTTAVAHLGGKLVTLVGLTPIVDTINPNYVQETYGDSHSHQSYAADLTLGTRAGSSNSMNPKYDAAAMFNVFGNAMISTADYLAGVIGAYSITGTKATSYPAGAVLGQITDAVTDADGAFVAYVDGDGDVTKANAAFKAMCNNSTAGSGFDYGVDLYSPTHDGYLELAILKADLRMSHSVCFLSGSGAPTDGTTGATFAEIGSLYVRRDTGKLYINGGTKTSPAWKLVTSA